VTDLRTCRTCGHTKELALFTKHKQCVGGITRECIACSSAKKAARRREVGRPLHTEKEKAAKREKYHANVEAISAKRKAEYAANAEARREAARAAYAANAEERRAKQRAYVAANPEKLATWRKQHYQNSAEKRKANAREWYVNNPDRARASRKAWAEANKGLVAAHKAARKKAVKQATPLWVDMRAIELVYERAADLKDKGEDVHVDHIVPIKSAIVCGLHVPWNLQILPAVVNIRKSNREWPDMP